MPREPVPFFIRFSEFLDSAWENKLPPAEILLVFTPLESQLNELKQALPQEQSRPSELQEEFANLERAFSWFAAGAEFVHRFASSADKKDLDQGLLHLEEAFNGLREGLIQLHQAQYTLGPSSDKPLNFLVNSVAAFKNGAITDEAFEAVFLTYADYFQKSSRNFRRMLKASAGSPQLFGEFESLVPAHEQAKVAFRKLEVFFSTRSFDQVNQSFDPLKEFSDAYSVLCENLQDRLEEQNKQEEQRSPDEKKCFRCGTTGPRIAWACRSCGFVFPQLELSKEEQEDSAPVDVAEGGLSRGFVMTENIEKVFDAVEDFQDGEIEKEELAGVLNWLNVKIENAMKNHKARQGSLSTDRSLSDGMKAILSHVDDELGVGLEELQKGLISLHEWAGSKEEALLLNGIQLAQDGAAKIWHSQSLAAKILEEIEPDSGPQGDTFSQTV